MGRWSTFLLLIPIALAPATAQERPVEVADLGGLETRTAALLLSGQEAGDLQISVLPIPMPPAAEGEASRVVLVVDIVGEPLLASQSTDSLVTEVYAYAVDGQGGVAGVLTQAFRVDLTTLRESLASGAIKFFGHLDLPAGDYSLRVLVLHRQSGRLRLRIAPVEVPTWREPILLTPLFPDSPDRFLIVHEAGGEASSPFPRVTDGERWVPSTAPRSTGETGLYLLSSGLSGGLRAHFLQDGREDAPSELGLGDLRPADSPRGLEMLVADLKTAGLPSGRHVLRISTAEGTVSAAAPFTIPLSESEESLRDELEEAVAVSVGEGPDALSPYRRSRGGEVERAEAAYVAALEHLTVGDRSAARLAILEHERAEIGGVLGERTSTLQQKLLQAEVLAALRLVGDDVDGLVPLISLHEELYRQYHRHRHFLLSTHSRQLLLALADAYLDRTDSSEAKQLVASAVASVAGYLQEIGTRLGAERAYQLALEYDPEDPTALIGLAILREAGGKYDSTAELLKQLLQHYPHDRHAKVRLAVNLRRLGANRRALRLLLECVSVEAGTDWATAVAFQELSNLYADEKKPEEAVAALEQAITRMPEQQRLYVQLAALLDRLGRPADAGEVLDRLDPLALDADSPRLRYEQLPMSYLARSRRMLAEGAERHLPARAEAASHSADPGSGGSEATP